MQKTQWLMLFHMSVLCAGLAHADSFSLTGTLATPESVQYFILNLPSAESLTLQTYGFGGGTNAAGTQISPVGTDPFLAVFAGTGPGAAILTDGAPRPGPNPFGTSLDLTNYSNFQGCPSANAPTIGGMPQCGDARMTFSSLAASTYTIALSDGQYQANAVFDNGTLGEGFVDFTGGGGISPVLQHRD